MLPSVREDNHFVEGSDAILAKSAALHCLYCQGVFLRKIRPDIGARIHLLEGRVHDGQQLQARKLTRQGLKGVLLGRVVDLQA